MSVRTTAIREARDLLLDLRGHGDQARRRFRWPDISGPFNWAIDWFDAIGRDRTDLALWIRDAEGSDERYSYAELVERSDRTAAWFASLGIGKGDTVMVMLGNRVELWVTQLALMKLGAIVAPTAQAVQSHDLFDRVACANVTTVVTSPEEESKFAGIRGVQLVTTGAAHDQWRSLSEADACPAQVWPVATEADDPLLYYFTSGTTKSPKLVVHTQRSYPVGHLSTMYFLGVRPGDVHLNISSPGWGKHAWSSFFAPWLAEATVFAYNYRRFDAAALLAELRDSRVTTFCAPPTVWRMMIQADLGSRPAELRDVVGAGEPLNPEVISAVRRAWGLTIRDGYGQTETTCTVGNAPDEPVKPGSMGRLMPGSGVRIVDPDTGEESHTGEIVHPTSPYPFNLMAGYLTGQPTARRDGLYHSGDLVTVDEDGYLTYVGRTDDVFKASDYKISPFELESVLIEHPAVAEAAIVPSPDPLRHNIPKAYIALAHGYRPNRETALSILAYAKQRLAPYLRVRRVEFFELPKTISGKVRRVELRAREAARSDLPDFRYEDFPELTSGV